MREVAEDAKKSNEEAAHRHLEHMRQEVKVDEAKWADHINEIKNASIEHKPELIIITGQGYKCE